MSFEGGPQFCSYDSPRALSYTVSLSFFPPPPYLCISARYLISPSHILSHLFPCSLLSSQWIFYWAALEPDVSVRRGWGGGTGGGGALMATDLMLQSLTLKALPAFSSPHFTSVCTVLVLPPSILLILYTLKHVTYTNWLPLPLPASHVAELYLNQPFDLNWERKLWLWFRPHAAHKRCDHRGQIILCEISYPHWHNLPLQLSSLELPWISPTVNFFTA